MKQRRKSIVFITCLCLSAVLLATFVVQTALFLLETASSNLSFGEAARKIVLFLMSASLPAATLCASAVFSAVSIKLSDSPGRKKLARGIFVAELSLLAVYALILLAMFVVFPEEWV